MIHYQHLVGITIINLNMSTIFNIDIKDVANGVLTAAIGGVLTFGYQLVIPCLEYIKNGVTCDISISWQAIGIVAFTSGVSYLIKRYGSNEQGEFLKQ